MGIQLGSLFLCHCRLRCWRSFRRRCSCGSRSRFRLRFRYERRSIQSRRHWFTGGFEHVRCDFNRRFRNGLRLQCRCRCRFGCRCRRWFGCRCRRWFGCRCRCRFRLSYRFRFLQSLATQSGDCRLDLRGFFFSHSRGLGKNFSRFLSSCCGFRLQTQVLLLLVQALAELFFFLTAPFDFCDSLFFFGCCLSRFSLGFDFFSLLARSFFFLRFASGTLFGFFSSGFFFCRKSGLFFGLCFRFFFGFDSCLFSGLYSRLCLRVGSFLCLASGLFDRSSCDSGVFFSSCFFFRGEPCSCFRFESCRFFFRSGGLFRGESRRFFCPADFLSRASSGFCRDSLPFFCFRSAARLFCRFLLRGGLCALFFDHLLTGFFFGSCFFKLLLTGFDSLENIRFECFRLVRFIHAFSIQERFHRGVLCPRFKTLGCCFFGELLFLFDWAAAFDLIVFFIEQLLEFFVLCAEGIELIDLFCSAEVLSGCRSLRDFRSLRLGRDQVFDVQFRSGMISLLDDFFFHLFRILSGQAVSDLRWVRAPVKIDIFSLFDCVRRRVLVDIPFDIFDEGFSHRFRSDFLLRRCHADRRFRLRWFGRGSADFRYW